MTTVIEKQPEIWLIRHGETEWSRSGQHTSRTDLPLTPTGEACAKELGTRLAGVDFAAIYTSPALRVLDTCRLAGFSEATIEPNLREWDYGIYEGRTTAEIQQDIPGWSIWTSSIIKGESLEQVANRADALIQFLERRRGRIALFAHAHILRILAARWVQASPAFAQHLSLGTGSISVLGFEREQRTIVRWNCASVSTC